MAITSTYVLDDPEIEDGRRLVSDDGVAVHVAFLGDGHVRIEVSDDTGAHRAFGQRMGWTEDDGTWFGLIVPAQAIVDRDGGDWVTSNDRPL